MRLQSSFNESWLRGYSVATIYKKFSAKTLPGELLASLQNGTERGTPRWVWIGDDEFKKVEGWDFSDRYSWVIRGAEYEVSLSESTPENGGVEVSDVAASPTPTADPSWDSATNHDFNSFSTLISHRDLWRFRVCEFEIYRNVVTFNESRFTQPGTDAAHDCLISRTGIELDPSSRTSDSRTIKNLYRYILNEYKLFQCIFVRTFILIHQLLIERWLVNSDGRFKANIFTLTINFSILYIIYDEVSRSKNIINIQWIISRDVVNVSISLLKHWKAQLM